MYGTVLKPVLVRTFFFETSPCTHCLKKNVNQGRCDFDVFQWSENTWYIPYVCILGCSVYADVFLFNETVDPFHLVFWYVLIINHLRYFNVPCITDVFLVYSCLFCFIHVFRLCIPCIVHVFQMYSLSIHPSSLLHVVSFSKNTHLWFLFRLRHGIYITS